jgi:4'-phosphopantetheinyl transferase
MSNILYWFAQNLADVPESNEWLCDAEQSILAGLRFPKRRNDWRLGRWTAKQAVLAHQHKEKSTISSLEIRAAEDGAPEAYWNNETAEVSISISHSEGRSFCIVGPGDFSIGCDLEWIAPREDNLVWDYFTPEEIFYCRQAREAERPLAVNLIWSAKESVLKILREGMRRDTRSIVVHPDSWGSADAWNKWTGRCLESAKIFSGWWRSDDGFVYTLAADRPTSLPNQLLRK